MNEFIKYIIEFNIEYYNHMKNCSECLKSKHSDFRQCRNPNASHFGFRTFRILGTHTKRLDFRVFGFRGVRISGCSDFRVFGFQTVFEIQTIKHTQFFRVQISDRKV